MQSLSHSCPKIRLVFGAKKRLADVFGFLHASHGGPAEPRRCSQQWSRWMESWMDWRRPTIGESETGRYSTAPQLSGCPNALSGWKTMSSVWNQRNRMWWVSNDLWSWFTSNRPRC